MINGQAPVMKQLLYVTADTRAVASAPCLLVATRVRSASMQMLTVNARCELTDPGGCSSVKRLLYVSLPYALRRCSTQEGLRTPLVQQLLPPLLQRQVGKVHYCLLKWSTYIPDSWSIACNRGLACEQRFASAVETKITSEADNTYCL